METIKLLPLEKKPPSQYPVYEAVPQERMSLASAELYSKFHLRIVEKIAVFLQF